MALPFNGVDALILVKERMSFQGRNSQLIYYGRAFDRVWCPVRYRALQGDRP
jgi:hypothetical protein